MAAVPSILQSYLLTALRGFLLFLVPGAEVLRGQDNRVPESAADNFFVITPLWDERLATTLEQYADCAFVGSLNNAQLSVSSFLFGQIVAGVSLWGAGVALGTTIVSGNKTDWIISPGGQSVSAEKMAAGSVVLTQSTRVVVQVDVHGSSSFDNKQLLTTVFRSLYGNTWFDQNYPGVTPLFAEDAKQVPFLNENQQVETRWTLEANLEIDPSVTLSQQFADQLQATLFPLT